MGLPACGPKAVDELHVTVSIFVPAEVGNKLIKPRQRNQYAPGFNLKNIARRQPFWRLPLETILAPSIYHPDRWS